MTLSVEQLHVCALLHNLETHTREELRGENKKKIRKESEEAWKKFTRNRTVETRPSEKLTTLGRLLAPRTFARTYSTFSPKWRRQYHLKQTSETGHQGYVRACMHLSNQWDCLSVALRPIAKNVIHLPRWTAKVRCWSGWKQWAEASLRSVCS